MSKMKKFLKYFIIIVIVYILVDIVSINIMKSTYKTKEFKFDSDTPTISISEFKATITNGYEQLTVLENQEQKQ